ncbi:MAG: hypothetical protein AXA67_08235 [Methylothermaceae bacteria B42]|nr:MAG: hypothetical protein AXA67_08235 [Methylothermaceae bacteria B42]HHJ38540.1 hypothetical protein [Methylothermaceae bacterium]
MLNKRALLVFGISAGLFAGCATQGSSGSNQSAAKEAPVAQADKSSAKIQRGTSPTDFSSEDIPANSPFAKVKKGMSEGRVYDLIGQPSEIKTYLTGKTWIPFYFGPDTHRKEALYKGQGRIVFTPSGALGTGVYKVFKVIYDPTEDGYAD